MKPLDLTGLELDAIFSVEAADYGFDLVIESRGGSDQGSSPSRNKDYQQAVPLLLTRMGALGMTLREVQIASSTVRALPLDERRLTLPGYVLPLSLASVADVDDLRLVIGRAGAAFGRQPTDAGSGNATKRLRLGIDWPCARGLSSSELELVLAGRLGEPGATELLTARVEAQRRAYRASGTLARPPDGTETPLVVAGAGSRFVRRADVIAWVLEAAAGACEACGQPAPFIRSDGEPYLEVHHVRPLAEGGPDTVDNAVGVCPNCHRQFHHGANQGDLRASVLGTIGRLVDYPRRP